MTYEIDRQILRAYDIRADSNTNLLSEDAYHIARAYAKSLELNDQPLKVCLGRDGRLSSPNLHLHFMKGLVDSGVEVFDIGVVPTPELYFSCYHLNVSAGVMITGSHNPGHHNGFKMVMDKQSFFGEDIQKFYDIIKNADYISGEGKIHYCDIEEDYVRAITNDSMPNLSGKVKIAWDPGNGATGNVVEKLVKILPGEHIVVNTKIDGSFPNHHPDPTVPENMEQVIGLVRDNQCDFGIAFDGDGDRLGLVDNTGRMIFGDQMLMIYATDLLTRYSGAKVIADVKTSNLIFDKIKSSGGEPIMWKTGHSHIKRKMKEEGCMLAGEMSGHLFFGENYHGFDDALFGAVKMMAILSNSPLTLAEMIDSLPKGYSTPEVRVDVAEGFDKFDIVEQVKTQATAHKLDFDDLDGIRVTKREGWWLLRASNTQDSLVIRVEGHSPEALEKLTAEVLEFFDNIKGADTSILSNQRVANG